jgi:hypothetical protein
MVAAQLRLGDGAAALALAEEPTVISRRLGTRFWGVCSAV